MPQFIDIEHSEYPENSELPAVPTTADTDGPGSHTPNHAVRCAVCETTLEQPGWFCVDCVETDGEVTRLEGRPWTDSGCAVYAHFCDNCERKSMIRCINFAECKRTFQQPSWYYSERFSTHTRILVCAQ